MQSEIGTFEVRETQDWRWKKAHSVQINPQFLETDNNKSDLAVGDYVLVENPNQPINPAIYGRIDTGEHLEEGEIGLNVALRHGIGVSPDSESQGEVTMYNKRPKIKSRRRLFNFLVGSRPVVCRMRGAVHPDGGFNICRLPEETFDALGIEPGDRVEVQSKYSSECGLISVKALPINQNIKNRKTKFEEAGAKQGIHNYPKCPEIMDMKDIIKPNADHPEIYLDAERREELGFEMFEHDGKCQPVTVYRDSQSYFFRKFNNVVIPILGGILSFIVVFKGVIRFRYLLFAFALIVGVILLSFYYEVRFTSLD